jgi:signal transduction histidine kinase
MSTRRPSPPVDPGPAALLYALGEELRTPLAPIVTALELMRLKGDHGLGREREAIARHVGRMSRLVDDLLEVARIMRGELELSRERVELAPVVERGLDLAMPWLERRFPALHVDVPEQGLALVGDGRRLAQAVQHLVCNAARAIDPRGHIWIEGRAEGDRVRLTVRDDGAGMDGELLRRAFEPFVLAAHGGWEGDRGLGMALARSLIEAHGGAVAARSEGPGTGSTFTVTLPRD